MSDDPINSSDHSLAKLCLADELRPIVSTQLITLFIILPGALLDCAGIGFGLLLAFLGIGVSILMALWGCFKLLDAAFLPVLVRIYAITGCALFPGYIFIATSLPMVGFILFYIFWLYGIVPQYFIARWLAKEAENDTIQAVERNNDLIG